MERTELWMEYQKGAKIFYVDLYDKDGLYFLLSEGGKKSPVWEGDLDISDYNLKELPDLSQIEVAGNFNAAHNLFKTFKGSPKRVGKDYIANGTRLGMSDTTPLDVMEGFPVDGVGGSLEIVSTSIDSQFKASEEKRAEDLKIVAELQKKVGGQIWTSADLFELREMIQDKQCEIGFSREELSEEKQKQWNDLKELSLFEISLSKRVIKRREDVDERDKRIKVGMSSEPTIIQGSSINSAKKKQMKDRRQQRETEVLIGIMGWIEATRQRIQLAQKNKKHGRKTADILRKIETRKEAWMKLYVLGELMAIAKKEKQYEELPRPIRTLWNRISNAFLPKNPVERGKGASLESVKEMKQQLWVPTKMKFNLDRDGMQKKIKQHQGRQYS